ncbi:hypothetical protein ABID58_005835 [Bradyrhizobium sp. S3.2.6]
MWHQACSFRRDKAIVKTNMPGLVPGIIVLRAFDS